MSADGSALMRAAALREEFDAAFARAPETELVREEPLLAIRVGGQPYVLRLAEVSGVFPNQATLALPGSADSLVGVAALRNTLVPVYDLRVLLGERDAATEPPAWFVIAAGEAGVGFAFDQVEGQIRVPASELAAEPRAEGSTTSPREVVRIDGVVRPMVAIPKLLETITFEARGPSKEG